MTEQGLLQVPEHGARNSFIFSMACNLHYICNDDASWIAAILPTYGEEAQKHRTTIQSAVNRPMSREMPDTRGMWEAMQAVGYKEKTKVLTRAQVRTIVQFLGEP